jgi:hypothetical protein
MATAPEKCRCASNTHGHKPGKCPNLATEPERLCKPCYDKTSAELAPSEAVKTSQNSARTRRGRSGKTLSVSL